MNLVVLDTNIIVSSLWNKNGIPNKIVKMVLDKELVICHDFRIINEYFEVLNRKKFAFNPKDVQDLLEFFQKHGVSVISERAKVSFMDESDRKFYEVARTFKASLVTGNLKHFPKEPFILSAAKFLKTVSTSSPSQF